MYFFYFCILTSQEQNSNERATELLIKIKIGKEE